MSRYEYRVSSLNDTRLNNLSRRVFLSSATVSTVSLSGSIGNAISSKEAEVSYNRYAASYDELDGGDVAKIIGIDRARYELLQEARGRVLEIGCGTGLNLGYYRFASSPNDAHGVTSLTLLDISDGMMKEAQLKLEMINIPWFVEVQFVKGDATSDLIKYYGTHGTFDTVVDTFSLCVMGNQGAIKCINQLKSVVKPKDQGGKLLLIENNRSSNEFIAGYQDLTADVAAKFAGKGCVSNQDVSKFIRDVRDLEIVEQSAFAAGLFRSYVCQRIISE